jgi:3-oxoacyl-[acyl-carrier protein] reductase
LNNATLVQTGPVNEKRRTRFYTMLTTPVPTSNRSGRPRTFPDEEWHKYQGVNAHGVFYCTREAPKTMDRQKAGKIIKGCS